eukprot:TRINITY_DN8237_c0_g1_i1.p1 TRINITY_DN8237_c0_g1~~TRINITY_DN8237_c0_g1_i1.p1  ORF type:complete len:105 (+),score=5.57 TRINITY_DN8237_c0_g1_i1:394-708(+)
MRPNTLQHTPTLPLPPLFRLLCTLRFLRFCLEIGFSLAPSQPPSTHAHKPTSNLPKAQAPTTTTTRTLYSFIFLPTTSQSHKSANMTWSVQQGRTHREWSRAEA